MKLAILFSTFLFVPAISFALGCNAGDPNCQMGFSDQNGGRVDVGAHAQTSGSVDFIQSMMKQMEGLTGSTSSSGVVYNKQASESLTRKNSKGPYKLKSGDNDAAEATDGVDGVVQ